MTKSFFFSCLSFILFGRFISAQVLSAGGYHSAYLCSSSSATGWGRNQSGELGNGQTLTSASSPSMAAIPTDITAVSCGYNFTMFHRNDGSVWFTGNNINDVFAFGTPSLQPTPVQVIGPGNILQVVAGDACAFFIKSDSSVWVCGSNNEGQLGLGTSTLQTPLTKVPGLTGIIKIAAGSDHTLFLKSDSTVWATGRNTLYQLGDSSYTSKNSPVKVKSISGVIDISAGYGHSLFLKGDGTVWVCGTWGGATGYKGAPVQLNINNVVSISTRYTHNLFIKGDSTAWANGSNSSGQLGDGTTINKLVPVQVLGLPKIIATACGIEHSLFLDVNKKVWACGKNIEGQVGDGSLTDRHLPVQLNNQCQLLNSVNDYKTHSDPFIYPNPVSDFLNIKSELIPVSGATITIRNLLGELVAEKKLSAGTSRIDMREYANGVYTCILVSGKLSQQQKIVLCGN